MSASNIKHFVIAGGGHSFFYIFGALRHLHKQNVWKKQHIESIYGTSAGGIIGALLCLDYHFENQTDWDTLHTYFVERPWHNTFPIDAKTIMQCYSNRGLFDKSFVETIFKPLFLSKDIPIDITMKQLYKKSNIDLHLFSFELNRFQTIDISHSTHAELPLLTALHMTSAFPTLFAPHITDDNQCYLDGGIINNYPLEYCIHSGKKKEEILGFRKLKETDTDISSNEKQYQITKSSTILDYIFTFLYKLIINFSTEYKQPKISNEILFDTKSFSFYYLKKCLTERDLRFQFIQDGEKSAEIYCNTLCKNC